MPQKRFRDTASFGKRQEYVVIAELLRRGYDAYQTLVDDQGIDCVIRRECGGGIGYLEIQIRARSKHAQARSHGLWPATAFEPRPNYVFIFYSEPLQKYWIIPSVDLAAKAKPRDGTKSKAVYDVFLSRMRKPRGSDTHTHVDTDEFVEYIDAWHLLNAT